MRGNVRIHLLRPFTSAPNLVGGTSVLYGDPLTNTEYADTAQEPVARFAIRTDSPGSTGTDGEVETSTYQRRYALRADAATGIAPGWRIIDIEEGRSYRVTSVEQPARRRRRGMLQIGAEAIT